MPNKNQFKTHNEYLEWYRNYRNKNRKKTRIYQRKWTKYWRKKNNQYGKSYKNTNPEKVKAQRLVAYALKIGIIKREPCKICKKERVEAHHNNYYKPLDVEWLCSLHHKRKHYEKTWTQNASSKGEKNCYQKNKKAKQKLNISP